jgi:dTDP-4-amino-4,6-dideoxygalactose transaminase
MGLCNLRYIKVYQKARKLIIKKYHDLLAGTKGVKLLYFDDNIEQNYAYLPIIIENEKLGKSRDDIYEELKIHNIHTRKYFFPLTSDQMCFGNKYANNDLQIARYCSERVLTLPVYPGLTDDEVTMIAKLIKLGE